MILSTHKIAVIGLGYVGLPLAVEFGKKRPVIGYDISTSRIAELNSGQDRTMEVDGEELHEADKLSFTGNPDDLRECTVFIVTVPTPVDDTKRPDLTPLIKASEAVGRIMPSGAIVIYESTVYPGATEEVCVPVLEKFSGKKFNVDFYCGYSPERINPGDKERRLPGIKKVTSGSTPEIAEVVDQLYRQIINAGTHKASSIKVAEASKVIENTQRDANIALINEFSLIFHRLGIDTTEVLEAAGTKWNFLPFRAGLVGGHCIGVDPYYLIQKAQSVGYYPDILLACRRINDAMGQHIASEVVKLMIKKGHAISGARVLVLGFTFKENCPDLRNTRVIDLVSELSAFGARVEVFDPWADLAEARMEYGIELQSDLQDSEKYDAVVIAVGHEEFKTLGINALRGLLNNRGVIYDVKGILAKSDVDARL